jgi:cyclase
MATVPYARGLHELGDGLFAYLQPDGGWGWSNAGLITGDATSLLVDTLFDIPLTSEMLEKMRPITRTRPIEAAVNTHANGDHCFGNGALPRQTTIYSSVGARQEMEAQPPALLQAALAVDLGPETNEFVARIFGPFQFEGLEPRLPDATFQGRLALEVGGRRVEVIEVGPAHTVGDAILHVPDAATVFTGDILFIGGTPIVWAGPVSNWISACDRIAALGARTIVPGHGSVTDTAGVTAVKRYLEYVQREARARFDAGLGPREAADDIELDQYSDWTAPERIVQNVEALYREFDPSRPEVSKLEIFSGMAAWSQRH